MRHVTLWHEPPRSVQVVVFSPWTMAQLLPLFWKTPPPAGVTKSLPGHCLKFMMRFRAIRTPAALPPTALDPEHPLALGLMACRGVQAAGTLAIPLPPSSTTLTQQTRVGHLCLPMPCHLLPWSSGDWQSPGPNLFGTAMPRGGTIETTSLSQPCWDLE